MTHPPIEAFASGFVATGDGNDIYWETSGSPEGKPVLYLHGGPGGGLRSGGYRRNFDPKRHLIVGVDQRGCGRSRPLVSDALATLGTNTTQSLIGDIEAVRAHLGVERWLVSGVSWGTTLALVYAQAHPDRVSELVLMAVTTTSRDEVQWITEGVGSIFPEAWAAFELASKRLPQERVVEAYARRLAGADPADRIRAAIDWNAWEDRHVSLDPNWRPAGQPGGAHGQDFATLVTHYWARDGFLTEGNEVLANLPSIAHIPVTLIHGRHDVSGPAITAYRLHLGLPKSTLTIVESEGHGGPLMAEAMCAAADGYLGRS
jgi:proline iminopeptidase